MDAQRAHLERVVGVTTTVLFVASVSYVAFSALYGCIQAGRNRRVVVADADPGAAARPGEEEEEEETKRALEGLPVQVVVVRDGGGGSDRKGAADQAVTEEVDGGECPVCLAEYEGGEEVRVLPACRHRFHRECVDRWLLTRAPTCPVCRAPVPRVKEGCAIRHADAAGIGAAGALPPAMAMAP